MSRLLMMLSLTSFAFPRMMNDNPEQGGSSGSATGTQEGQPPQGSQGSNNGQQAMGLDFIPEAYRQNSWASKYTNADDFFKSVDHMSKMIGQKQIVQGIQIPGENATAEELSSFYTSLGRPEASDKYTYAEDLKGYEGLDLESEKKGFSEIAFANGLTQKQADAVFKAYLERSNSQFGAGQERAKLNFDKALTVAFGENFQSSLDMAKKGAKSLQGSDSITLEELSDPLTLKVLAKLGEYVGEDGFVDGNSTQSNESLLEEAQRLQRSQLYQKGDTATLKRVEEIYQTVYPSKK